MLLIFSFSSWILYFKFMKSLVKKIINFFFLLCFLVVTVSVFGEFGKRVTHHKGAVIQKEPFHGLARILVSYKAGSFSDPYRITVKTEDLNTVVVLGSGTDLDIDDSVYFKREEKLNGFVYNILLE